MAASATETESLREKERERERERRRQTIFDGDFCRGRYIHEGRSGEEIRSLGRLNLRVVRICMRKSRRFITRVKVASDEARLNAVSEMQRDTQAVTSL